jgi:hypothetical protein
MTRTTTHHTTTPPAAHGCLYHEKLAERVRLTRDDLAHLESELSAIRKTLRWMFFVLGAIGAGAWGAPDLIQAAAKLAGGGP